VKCFRGAHKFNISQC